MNVMTPAVCACAANSAHFAAHKVLGCKSSGSSILHTTPQHRIAERLPGTRTNRFLNGDRRSHRESQSLHTSDTHIAYRHRPRKPPLLTLIMLSHRRDAPSRPSRSEFQACRLKPEVQCEMPRSDRCIVYVDDESAPLTILAYISA